MKKNKITIYMYSVQSKIWVTIASLFVISFLTLLIILLGAKLPWYAILFIIVLDLLFLFLIFHAFFSRIVLDETLGVLALYRVGVKNIPIQDIKIVKRDEFVFCRKGGDYCRIEVALIKGDKHTVELGVPMIGRKAWLEYVDEEIERLNKRIDEWYMEYRKANKKR